MALSAQSLGLLIMLTILIPTVLVVRKHSRQMDAEEAFHRASQLARQRADAPQRAAAAARAEARANTPKPKPVAITKPRAPRRDPAVTASLREFRAEQDRKRHHIAQTARNIARIENCKIGKTTR